jgi:type II secretory pathway pseudopilin PulG
MRVNRPHARSHRRPHERGLSLIELVIAVLIVGISSVTIASLLVTSLDFSRDNTGYEQQLRAAESCYETLLASSETEQWKSNQDGSILVDQCDPTTEVTESRLRAWLGSGTYDDFYTRDGGKEAICKPTPPRCTTLSINGQTGVRFTIPVRGDQTLELVIPVEGDYTPNGGGL